jgi:hypothetical protein
VIDKKLHVGHYYFDKIAQVKTTEKVMKWASKKSENEVWDFTFDNVAGKVFKDQEKK